MHPDERLKAPPQPREQSPPLHTLPPATHHPRHLLLDRGNGRLPHDDTRRGSKAERAGYQREHRQGRPERKERHDAGYRSVQASAMEAVERVHGAGGAQSALYGAEFPPV